MAPSPGSTTEVPEEGEKVLLCSEKYEIQKTVEYVKDIRGVLAVKFRGIDSINAAYKLVNYSVYSTRTPPPAGLETEIIDFAVKDTAGEVWGNVQVIEAFSLNQVMEVAGPGGDVFYVPFTSEIVREIDHEKRLIIIEPPAGLKELNK
jgi:16S rRNA processing protein RimM